MDHSSTTISAMNSVLEVTELVEAILLRAEPAALIQARRVNKHFKNMIDFTTSIRKKLFLDAEESPRSDGSSTINRLLFVPPIEGEDRVPVPTFRLSPQQMIDGLSNKSFYDYAAMMFLTKSIMTKAIFLVEHREHGRGNSIRLKTEFFPIENGAGIRFLDVALAVRDEIVDHDQVCLVASLSPSGRWPASIRKPMLPH